MLDTRHAGHPPLRLAAEKEIAGDVNGVAAKLTADEVTKLSRTPGVVKLWKNEIFKLTADPRVKEAALKATEQFGTGCSGSRYLNGTLNLHDSLLPKGTGFSPVIWSLISGWGFVFTGLLGFILPFALASVA